MKKLKFSLIFPFICIVSLIAESDLINLTIKNEVDFSNGFGTVQGKPNLNDKSLADKLELQGEYNVDKQSKNAVIEFNKVIMDGKTYNLNNAFSKKGRLKSVESKLTKDSNITVSGGSKAELLEIINAVDKTTKEDKNSNKDTSNSKNSYGTNYSSGGGYGGESSRTFQPTYTTTDKNSSSDNTSNGTGSGGSSTDNSALVVECPKNTYSDGLATYYEQLGTICSKKTTNSVETKYNTKSCLNKVDYKNNTIQLGYQLFATDAESGGTYLVQQCQYTEPIALKSDVEYCKATIDYKNNKAFLQKRYFYNYENLKTYVGECTPTDEEVPLSYDLNACKDDRHDFENNVSYARGQYYYIYNNQRIDTGECMDIPKYTYKHYKDASTCEPTTINDIIFWEERVAYNDLNGAKKFATDCAVVNTLGEKLLTEFAGYSYSESAQQAIRKENQYFIHPITKEKIIVNANVLTSKAYSYQNKQCDEQHDDQNKVSRYYKEIFFNDTDEGKKVNIQECKLDTSIPYTLMNGATNETFISDLGYKRLGKTTENKYYLWNEPTKFITHNNGIFPALKSSKEDISKYVWGIYYGNTLDVKDASYSTGCGGENIPALIPYGTAKSCVGGAITTNSKDYVIQEMKNIGSCLQRTEKFTQTYCNYYDYWERIGEYKVKAEYLRGNGTSYVIDGGTIYKILK
ncbi:hypothetical protein N3114_12710 (plasmid) [Aliarcobacter butzleri]|uniref:hypothetical protein n=1 Tax=Aliarcobacter butzleri TaxID=28197 RepID=UPI0021B3FD83|nr:hypothetical protein [Aliarcobacter butzleri]UXC30716.1 hypothetical protein N3114_12710 [Aliarcobacter butzleri]